ncbi:MAG: PH domain-containing protein [Oscillospiraceae bacterium]
MEIKLSYYAATIWIVWWTICVTAVFILVSVLNLGVPVYLMPAVHLPVTLLLILYKRSVRIFDDGVYLNIKHGFFIRRNRSIVKSMVVSATSFASPLQRVLGCTNLCITTAGSRLTVSSIDRADARKIYHDLCPAKPPEAKRQEQK